MSILMQELPDGATMICTPFHEKRGPMGRLTISSIGCELSWNYFFWLLPAQTLLLQTMSLFNLLLLQDSTMFQDSTTLKFSLSPRRVDEILG